MVITSVSWIAQVGFAKVGEKCDGLMEVFMVRTTFSFILKAIDITVNGTWIVKKVIIQFQSVYVQYT